MESSRCGVIESLEYLGYTITIFAPQGDIIYLREEENVANLSDAVIGLYWVQITIKNALLLLPWKLPEILCGTR